MMYRSSHPYFGTDPDLPGGTLELGETDFESMQREVMEETGVSIEPAIATELYSGAEYSTHNSLYVLFEAKLETQPEIVMSWEHSSYEWLDRQEFIQKARSAKDTYMHMVADVLESKT